MQIVIDIPDGIYQDIEERDWRMPMYEFCGQVVITIACIVGGFWMITR